MLKYLKDLLIYFIEPFRILAQLVVPITNNLFSKFFGTFFINTNNAYKIGLENLGPKSIYSINLSILSNTTQDRGDL